MNTSVLAPRKPRNPSSKLSIGAFAALLLSLIPAFFAAGPAEAATYAIQAGQIGTVTINGPMLNAYDVGLKLNNGTEFYTKNWNVAGFTVTRSPATDSQWVRVVSTIQRHDGQWVDVQTRTWSGTVSGADSLTFPEWTWSPTDVPGRASYRVNYQIAWLDSSSGEFLALTAILPNTYDDNKCSARVFLCTSYTDGLNF